jgi:hypothetical protein
MSAWRGWYHVTGGTYGTWLRGDPRGWRDRKHRTHVEGDYRRPPPKGTYEGLLGHVRASMKRPPARLTAAERRTVGQAMVEKLAELQSEVLCFAVDAVHYHFLVRFSQGAARRIVGKAKLHAYHELVRGQAPRKLWAKRCRVRPIESRAHQVRTYRYILEHAPAGAWVWCFRQGLYWRPAGG